MSRPQPVVITPAQPKRWYTLHITSPKVAAAGGESRSWQTTIRGAGNSNKASICDLKLVWCPFSAGFEA